MQSDLWVTKTRSNYNILKILLYVRLRFQILYALEQLTH